MDVELLYLTGCPNVGLARERIAMAAQEAGIAMTLHEREVPDEAGAVELGMRGSPTVLAVGVDVGGPPGGGGAALGSMSCRLYHSEAGVEGAPAVAELVAALRAVRRDSWSDRTGDIG